MVCIIVWARSTTRRGGRDPVGVANNQSPCPYRALSGWPCSTWLSPPASLFIVKRRRVPSVVCPQRAEVVVEALSHRHTVDDSLAARDVPLCRSQAVWYPTSPYEFGKGDFTGWHIPAFAADRIAAGQQGRTRGTTDVLGIEVGKPSSLQQVDPSPESY